MSALAYLLDIGLAARESGTALTPLGLAVAGSSKASAQFWAKGENPKRQIWIVRTSWATEGIRENREQRIVCGTGGLKDSAVGGPAVFKRTATASTSEVQHDQNCGVRFFARTNHRPDRKQGGR